MSLFKKLGELVCGKAETKLASAASQPRLKVMEIRERIYTTIDSHLTSNGFGRKKPRDIWFRARADDFLDVVSIQTITPFGPTELVLGNVRVGIHCEQINKVFDRLCGDPYEIAAPTFTSYIGYIMPQGKFIEWRFPRDQFAEDEARKMAETIVKYGLPWFAQFTSLELLRHGIATYSLKGPREINLALLDDLLGRRESAIQILKSVIECSEKPEAVQLERKALALFTGQENGQ